MRSNFWRECETIYKKSYVSKWSWRWHMRGEQSAKLTSNWLQIQQIWQTEVLKPNFEIPERETERLETKDKNPWETIWQILFVVLAQKNCILACKPISVHSNYSHFNVLSSESHDHLPNRFWSQIGNSDWRGRRTQSDLW